MNSNVALLILPLLAGSTWLDLRRRRIPNWIVSAVTLLWLVDLASGNISDPWRAVGIAIAVLAIGMLIWRFRWLGGGDVKLIAALSLWAGPANIRELLVAIGLAGGALAVLAILAARLGEQPLYVLARARAAKLAPIVPRLSSFLSSQGLGPARSLPYGVAIACGGVWLVDQIVAA